MAQYAIRGLDLRRLPGAGWPFQLAGNAYRIQEFSRGCVVGLFKWTVSLGSAKRAICFLRFSGGCRNLLTSYIDMRKRFSISCGYCSICESKNTVS